MAFQSVPSTAEVTLNYSQDGEPTQNVFHFTYTSVWTKNILTQVCDGMGLWWKDHFRTHLPSTTQLIAVNGKGLEFVNDVVAAGDNGVGDLGLLITTPEPNNVSFSCWRKSAFSGKSARGRIYVPGVVKSDTSNNRLSLTRADGYITELNKIVAGTLLPSGVVHVVVSRETNNAVRPVGVTFVVEEYGYANLVLDSRRDRMPE